MLTDKEKKPKKRVSFAIDEIETPIKNVTRPSKASTPTSNLRRSKDNVSAGKNSNPNKLETLKLLATGKASIDHLKGPDYGKVPKEQNKLLQDMVKPHVSSYNWFLTEGIKEAIKRPWAEMDLAKKKRLKVWFKSVKVWQPMQPSGDGIHSVALIYPNECHLRDIFYESEVTVRLGWKINGVEQESIEKSIGRIPMMVKSAMCNLSKLSPEMLVRHGEEPDVAGGYFIVSGNEKIIRLLIANKRNFPIACKRQAWKKEGESFTEFGIAIRSVRPDNTLASVINLHLLTTGSIAVSFNWQKAKYQVPIMYILRAVCRGLTDRQIYDEIMRGEKDTDEQAGFVSYISTCVMNMLRNAEKADMSSSDDVLTSIGEMFRHIMYLPDHFTDIQVAEYLIENTILIHLDKPEDKAALLIYMIKKLYHLAKERCVEESMDNLMFQEIILPGHAMQMMFYDQLCEWMRNFKFNMVKEFGKFKELNEVLMKKVLGQNMTITKGLRRAMSVGHYLTKNNLGPVSAVGLTVAADRLNHVRFSSHFRSLHRGSFFANLRTTTVRKLRPESYGFICPVHTPDGAPCGLLTHLTFPCEIVTEDYSFCANKIVDVFGEYVFIPRGSYVVPDVSDCMQVLFDGDFIGWVLEAEAPAIVDKFRLLRATEKNGIPRYLEICLVPRREGCAQYPGLYIFNSPARLVRPVMNVVHKVPEYIGVFEQVYMRVVFNEKELVDGETTHVELNNYAIFSEIPSFIPFMNFNQACRDLFQCQMAKQTMGVPYLNTSGRMDQKAYRLHTPQSPIVRTCLYDTVAMDEHPIGTNAVIAVMSYTGFDMEDAIIINKASYDRGMFDACIQKTERINLREKYGLDAEHFRFAADPGDSSLVDHLGLNGLPYVGDEIKPGNPLYSVQDTKTKEYKLFLYKGVEAGRIERVLVIADDIKRFGHSLVKILIRIPRRPMIGDKFCNRHGQKGVASCLYPPEDMPYTEDGVIPDIIFNPHGFPSRMTIGMMLEIMAGKSGSLQAVCHDGSPFLYNSDNDAIDHFGNLLKSAGYNYYGNDIMYSGVTGAPLQSYIFMGVVYYQRLRHMVLDKWQARSIGSIDRITQQPIGGRKRGGGVRFGEMERDSLIAHGASRLLQDRLVNCSDGVEIPICSNCGRADSVAFLPADADEIVQEKSWKCVMCPRGEDTKPVVVVKSVHVLRYFVHLMAGLNLAVKFDVEED